MTETQTQKDAGIEDQVGETGDGSSRSSRHRRETPEAQEARVTAERLEQAKGVAGDLRHQRGCPDEGKLPGEGDSRVEHYPATRPATANTPEEPLLVVRCSRCGEAEVVPDESEA